MNTFQATLALTIHRPESVESAKQSMARHDAIILEEPPSDHFKPMLDGDLNIDDYLQTLDWEYPHFARLMAQALRELYHAGHAIYQIEPFLEGLLEIHEHFAAGGSPADLQVGSHLHAIYEAEKKATTTLIRFYDVSVNGTFEDTLLAVKRFARADAHRFKLRDHSRAEAIAAKLLGGGSFYIEAGMMHYPLWMVLKRRLPSEYKIMLDFPLRRSVRKAGLKGRLYGPGDLLTLHYIFHENVDPDLIDLLAARALVFNKLITKDEIIDDPQNFPHTRNEFGVEQTVRQLSLADCRRLFPVIRRVNTAVANDMVNHFLTTRQARFTASPK
jgi:hypothetical protein